MGIFKNKDEIKNDSGKILSSDYVEALRSSAVLKQAVADFEDGLAKDYTK